MARGGMDEAACLVVMDALVSHRRKSPPCSRVFGQDRESQHNAAGSLCQAKEKALSITNGNENPKEACSPAHVKSFS